MRDTRGTMPVERVDESLTLGDYLTEAFQVV
jgi:hypothetical protein